MSQRLLAITLLIYFACTVNKLSVYHLSICLSLYLSVCLYYYAQYSCTSIWHFLYITRSSSCCYTSSTFFSKVFNSSKWSSSAFLHKASSLALCSASSIVLGSRSDLSRITKMWGNSTTESIHMRWLFMHMNSLTAFTQKYTLNV